jgi:hypothetical protein
MIGRVNDQRLSLIKPVEGGFHMTNRWWLAASLALSLGLAPFASAQEKKSGGMMEGESKMEQKGDAMKKDAMKSKDAMKDKGAMKSKDAMKDKGGMKDTGSMKDADKMGKQ